MHFLIKKYTDFIEKLSPDGAPKGSQNAYFGGPLGCLFQDLSKEPKMEPKWLQNGAKMEPKSLQNGVKIQLKRIKTEAKNH